MATKPTRTTVDKEMSFNQKKWRCAQACTILGQSFIYLPNGIRWLWGNLTVYTSSYFYFRGGVTAKEVNTPWLLSIYMVAWAAGVFVSGPLVKCIGRRSTQIFGVFMYDGGLLLAYLSVRYNSLMALNATLGLAMGFGTGVSETVIILVVTDWAGKHQGMFLSLVFSSAIFGSFFLNQLATWYINPLNLKARLQVGESLFFTQPSLLERTPSFFLILFVISIVIHLAGMLITSFNPKDTKMACSYLCCCCFKDASEEKCFKSKEPDKVSLTEIESNVKLSKHSVSSLTHPNRQAQISLPSEESYILEKDSNINRSEKVVKLSEDVNICNSENEITKTNSPDVTPRELLLKPTFHSLWFGYTCSELAKVWLFNYYKIYGLRYIPNDHFLTNLGAFMAVMASLSRSVWGWSSDRLGMKPILIICTIFLIVISSFFSFTALVDKWLYAVATLAFGAVNSGYSILTTLVTVHFFGKTHFAVNYGLVCVPSIAANVIAPVMFEGFLEQWGWFPLLFTIAAFNALALVILLCVMPRRVQ